jgi:hypothetical protein
MLDDRRGRLPTCGWGRLQEFADLDTLLAAIGGGADGRIAFQSSFSATPA